MQQIETTDEALRQLGVEIEYAHNNPGHGGRVVKPSQAFGGLNLRPSIATRSGKWFVDIPDDCDTEMGSRFGKHFYRLNDGTPVITSFPE